MELLDGMDLDALVRRDGPQPAWRVVRIVRQVCLSLAEAHEQGLIHRDIKPANIFLCRQGAELDIIKVLDFGLVTGVSRSDRPDPGGLTRDDDLLGTPAFMAPEMVVAPDDVDHRVDLYALGCVAYRLLAGRQLFEESTVEAQLFAHVHQEIPSPLVVNAAAPVPGALETLVARLLAKSPADRPQSAREILTLLEQIELSGEWDERPLREWWRTVEPRPASAPDTPTRTEVVLRSRRTQGPGAGQGAALDGFGPFD